jgi:hypothetical protein
MDNQNKDQKSQTNKHLENKNKFTFKFSLKEGNLNLGSLLLLPHLQKHEGVWGGGVTTLKYEEHQHCWEEKQQQDQRRVDSNKGVG